MPLTPDEKRQYDRSYYKDRVKPRRAVRRAMHDALQSPPPPSATALPPSATAARLAANAAPPRRIPITFRIDETLFGRILRMREEGALRGTLPWKTTGAALRGLIVRGLESMRGTGNLQIDEALPYLETMRMVEQLAIQRREAEGLLHTAITELQKLQEIGATDVAVQVFHALREEAQRISASAYRDWLLLTLDKAFPQLLQVEPQGVTVFSDEDHRAAVGNDRPTLVKGAKTTRSTKPTRKRSA